jgi:hypothetical protein
MVSVVPYHRCIRVCMAGYKIGRIHVVTVRVKCSGAHIDKLQTHLYFRVKVQLSYNEIDILMIKYDM